MRDGQRPPNDSVISLETRRDAKRNSNGKASSACATLIYRTAADVRPEHHEWLWDGQIPLGAFSLMSGETKRGKTLLGVDFAACATAGKAWPDGSTANRQGRWLIMSAEDDVARTIVPRLIAAGADMTRVDIVDGLSTEQDGEAYFDFDTGLAALDQYSATHSDLLAVSMDPVLSYMGRVEAHKPHEVRNALRPYCKLAEERRFAILGVNHLNRSTSTDAFARILSSSAFGQVARANFLVVHDAENDGRQLFIPFGTNIGPASDGFAYTIETAHITHDGRQIKTARVVWGERVAISAQEALQAAAGTQHSRRGKLDEACELIVDTLRANKCGKLESTALKDRVMAQGVSWGTFKNAKDKLRDDGKITSWKGRGDDRRWFIELTDRASPE